MADDNFDTRQIEAELERDRARLADSLDSLRSRLSPSAMADDAWSYAKDQLGPLTRSADQAIRDNPMAAVLIGVGAAWLVFGRRSSGGIKSGEMLAGTKYEALTRWEDEGGNPAPLPEPDLNWVTATDDLRQKARAALRKIDKDLRDKLLAPAEAERQRRCVLDDVRHDSNIAFRRGLDRLSQSAQDRIAAARETAYLSGGKAARKGARMIDDRPFAAGGLAFAIGAAVGALLPRTDAENRVFGSERDRLMREAEDLLRHEKDRAAGVLSDFVGTVRHELDAAAHSIVGPKT